MSRPSSPKSSSRVPPFYEPPVNVGPRRTPSQIIREAREKLTTTSNNNNNNNNNNHHNISHSISSQTAGGVDQQSSSGGGGGLIRTLNSTRPFTPREEKRSLFGPKSNRLVGERPPSSFSIGSKSFDSDVSRPLSATRLSPIDKPPSSAKSITASIETFEDDTPATLRDTLSLGSPLLSKSRLAPLEMPPERKASSSSSNGGGGGAGSSSRPSSDKLNTTKKNSTESASATSSSKEDEKINEIWRVSIEPILTQMNSYFKDALVDEFCTACDQLNIQLELHQMMSKTCSKRATILKLIFKYLDTDIDRIKIKISRLILNMKVTSNNLTNICRLLFSVSRNTDNDAYFMDNDILDSLLASSKRLDFRENSDSVVYFCGTIKNLSENHRLLKKLSAKNVEEILIKIIKDLSKYYKDNETLKSETGHALVQLTATLRNLADLSNTRHKFLNLNLIEQLVYILKYYTSDGELMLNVSRILSKLTLHADCCLQLAAHASCYKSFIKIMIKHDSKQDLIVRVSFVLGNLTSRDEEARVKFVNEKYSIDTLINILKTYFQNDVQAAASSHQEFIAYKSNSELQNINENEPSPNEDVMIKVIRVIANLAINERAGTELAARKDLLETLLVILETKDLSCEELIIDAIVTINNISFYNSDVILGFGHKLIDTLMKYLLSNNMDAILEVFRVFANLSRLQPIRSYLVARKVNVLAIVYLNSANRELVFIVIGVLINIMTDPENRSILKQEKAVKKLIEILGELGQTDWQLSSMICKLLMNYSEKTKVSLNYSHFDPDEVKSLKTILKQLLDEKQVIRIKSAGSNASDHDENLDEYMICLWRQDFSPVATLLLKRISEET